MATAPPLIIEHSNQMVYIRNNYIRNKIRSLKYIYMHGHPSIKGMVLQRNQHSFINQIINMITLLRQHREQLILVIFSSWCKCIVCIAVIYWLPASVATSINSIPILVVVGVLDMPYETISCMNCTNADMILYVILPVSLKLISFRSSLKKE